MPRKIPNQFRLRIQRPRSKRGAGPVFGVDGVPDEGGDVGVPVVGYEGCGDEGLWVQVGGYLLEDFWDIHFDFDFVVRVVW